MTFEQIQEKKVKTAIELLKKLAGARERLATAEELQKQELVKTWLNTYKEALEELKELVEAQKTLCPPDNQCKNLLQEEIDRLEEAVRHLKEVIDSMTSLEHLKISKTLILISSREHSLAQLLKT